MSSHTPVEIWEKILKYAISVPLFFESDPAHFGVELLPRYYDEADYWISERTRNKLKRVSRSWESFLKLYDYRYVRLSDIHHQRIPVAVAPLSIRLNIDQDFDCVCKEYCQSERVYPSTIGVLRKILRFASGGKASHPMWRTEILDGELPEDQADFDLLVKSLPRVRAVVHCGESSFSRIQEYQNTLQFLSFPGAWWLRPLTRTRVVTFPRLTTLQLVIDVTDLSVIDWSLPSLRHLSVRHYGHTNDGWKHVMDVLKALGPNLLTLYHCDETIIEEEAIPEKIWGYIPRVERIELPYWASLCPPEYHPARYARISMDTIEEVWRTREYNISEIVLWLPQWRLSGSKSTDERDPRDFRQTMIVQMDTSWLWYLTDNDANPKSLPLWIAEFYGKRGIRFTDNGSFTLHEYILFMVKWYWKGGCAGRKLRGSYRDLFRF